MSVDIETLMRRGPVIPVVTLDAAEPAVELARALVAGGVDVIEITLRTPAALEALAAVARSVPEITAGLGTVWRADQVEQAIEHGAEFVVSPGVADTVDTACRERGIAYLPGAQTVSEVAHIAARGRYAAKLFPAAALGGPAAIKAYASVLPEMIFCPTGGIDADSAPDYLALASVACVGGSWLAPTDRVAGGDWAAIRAAAVEAVELGVL